MRLKAIAAVVCLTSASIIAHASSISGTLSISGNDTFDSSQITFNPTTGSVYQANGTLSDFAPTVLNGLSASYLAKLTSFSFAHSAGVTIYSVTNTAGQVLSFTITDASTPVVGSDRNGPTLSLSGHGYFTENGFESTKGDFSLTSSSAGITGFQLVTNTAAPTVTATPEPSSVTLLGTGLLGVAGLARRRFIKS